MDIFLTTYPRSGSWLFAKTLYRKTGFPINKFHWKIITSLKTVSIIRNPKDTLTSKIAMEVQNNNYSLNIENVKSVIQEYISFYSYIEKNVSIIIDYDALVKDPQKTIEVFAQRNNLKILEDETYVPDTGDDPEIGYWVTSKKLSTYKDVERILEDADLSEAYKIYERLLASI